MAVGTKRSPSRHLLEHPLPSQRGLLTVVTECHFSYLSVSLPNSSKTSQTFLTLLQRPAPHTR